jgi:hypothetical protein
MLLPGRKGTNSTFGASVPIILRSTDRIAGCVNVWNTEPLEAFDGACNEQRKKAKFACPVCKYSLLLKDPSTLSYEICPQCGVEFGNEPREVYSKITAAWIAAGMPFWRTNRDWRAKLEQLTMEPNDEPIR